MNPVDNRTAIRAIEWTLVAVAGVGSLVVAWANFGLVPHWTWSSARLAMMLRPAFGLPLYPSPEAPALNDWMYGPVGSVAYLLAAMAHDPLSALRMATILNAIYFILPPLLAFALVGRRTGGLVCLWGFLFCLAAMLNPVGVWYDAAVLQVDTVAICLGMLSCAALVHDRRWLAAILAVLAIWTKQIAAPMALAQLGYVMWEQDWRSAGRYALRLTAVFVGVTLLSIAIFGARNLWFNLVRLPLSYPIAFDRLAGELPLAFSTTWWVILVAAIGWKWAPPRRALPENRAANLAWLFLLTAITLLPLGVVAVSKYGGHQNSLHSLAYGILGAAMLLTLLAANEAWRGWIARFALIVAACGLVGLKLHRVRVNGYLNPEWSGRRHQEAFELAQARPGQAYFPLNPLVTLFADGHELPFEGCYHELVVTHRAPPAHEIRAALPPTLRFVIYHDAETASGELDPVLPEFSQVRRTGEWIMRLREDQR